MLPQRIRWRSTVLLRDEARASKVAAAMLATSGVVSCAVNAQTGSILVHHDGTMHPSTLTAILTEALATLHKPGDTIQLNPNNRLGSTHPDMVIGVLASAAAATASLVRILSMGSAVNALVHSGGGRLSLVPPHAFAGIAMSTFVYIECRRQSALAWRRLGLATSRDRMIASLHALLVAEMAQVDALAAKNGITEMLNDIGDLERAFDGVGELVLLAGNTAVLFSTFVVLAPRLGWIPLVTLAAMLAVLAKSAVADKGEVMQDERSMAQRQALEAVEALPTIKSYGLEARTVKDVAETLDRHVRIANHRAAGDIRDPLRLEAITMAGVATTTVVAATALAGGAMNPGTHLALMMISGHLFYPFAHTSIPISQVRKGWAAHRRLARLASLPAETDIVATAAAPIRAPSLGFRSVSFTYPGSEVAALDEVSFEVPAAGFVAIVGASGSGKSTLTRLLLRFYEPGGGSIVMDGQDTAMLTKGDVRNAIAWVDQRGFLFDGTIAENIALSYPGADRTAIERAAHLAAVDEFTDRKAERLDIAIGQRGARLSDGQRQRVLLARALLKPSPVLVLDEATAALDAETERRVLANVRDHARDRTLIVIAHHLASIKDADRIVVMEAGTVVGQGSHTELLGGCPAYRLLLEAS